MNMNGNSSGPYKREDGTEIYITELETAILRVCMRFNILDDGEAVECLKTLIHKLDKQERQ